MDKEYKGFEVENEKISIEGESVIGKVDLIHRGKIGGIKITVEGDAQFFPLVDKAIDKFEQIIPGDQTAVASMLKSALRSIKIKL